MQIDFEIQSKNYYPNFHNFWVIKLPQHVCNAITSACV